MDVGVVVGLEVERMPFLICFWWPLAVAREGARCLRTRAEVRPGHVWKNPASIALHHVSGVGLKAAAWRKVMRSLLAWSW